MTRKAFTLIELLVVIAIIAILAAILFPVFAQAKLAAKKTAGLSAIKQIGTGAQIYLNDADDVLPPYRWNVADTGPDVNPFYLSLAAGDPRKARFDSDGMKTRKAVFANQMLSPYIKSDDLWECGANAEAWVNFQDRGTWDANFYAYGGQNSFAFNNYLVKSNEGTSATSVAEPSNTVYMIDATYYNTLPAMPGGVMCKLNGYGPTGSSYTRYWKHLGNSKLNFNNLGTADATQTNDPTVVKALKDVESRWGGVLNVVRTDTSAKAMNARAVVLDLVSKREQSMWNPGKTPCE